MVSGGHSDALLPNFELMWFLVDIAEFDHRALSCPGILGRSYIALTEYMTAISYIPFMLVTAMYIAIVCIAMVHTAIHGYKIHPCYSSKIHSYYSCASQQYTELSFGGDLAMSSACFGNDLDLILP